MLYLKSVLATHYNRVMEAPVEGVEGKTLADVMGDVIVFVGLDADTVREIIEGGEFGVGGENRETIYRDLRNRLAEMVANGDINIDREYTVTLSFTVSSGVEETVEAASADEAGETVRQRFEDGDYGDVEYTTSDFLNNANIDSVDIDHVDLA